MSFPVPVKYKLTATLDNIVVEYSNGQEWEGLPSPAEEGGITPTGTKQISITENGVYTEDVAEYANAEISVNVEGMTGGIPLLKSETVTESTRYVNIDLAPYLVGKHIVILAINFELTADDWLYYAINASAPQTSGPYGNNKATSHNTIPFLYGDLGGYGQTCVLPSSGNVFGRYAGSEAVSSLMINTYNASVSIKAGSTYSIYGM